MDPLSRRSFIKTSAAGAGAAASILLGTSKTSWAGANDRVRVAVMGINGRGRSHIGAYSRLENVEIAGICDVDAKLLPAAAKGLGKSGKTPKTAQDFREFLDDPDIDAISMATPNHWHSLGTIWACQADKDVFVEKPMSHNIFEGRKVVEAAAKYNRIVQHGTQLRSNPGFQEGINELKNGLIGDVYMARCVCYKWRPSIGQATPGNPPETLDWNLWQGPAQEAPFYVNNKGEGIYVHYYWHWVWAYGNGDIGNQGVHQLDAARWGLGVDVPYRVTSMGGNFLWGDAQEIFNVSSTSFMFKGEDDKDKMITLEVRPWYTNDEAGGTSFGVIFYGSEGWMTFPGYGSYKAYRGIEQGKSKTELIKEGNDGNDLYHYQNFIDCVRSRDASKLTAPPIEGHYSSALSHYALAGARVNRVLEIDTAAEQVINDDEANSMLTREYREGFVVPEVV
ncbi:MAG: Gfo/Idh/MocA family oxidoreductase [Candidatus Hydrogenedens sp.]|jgi:predicted dehydrogenase|nr:Gfo/Idh/MocA family oxidoreductase [Candidatus Hydrogenedens sp.]